MTDHLPECPHSEPALSPGFLVMCICDRLRACEQRIRLADDDYAYVAGQAEADGRRRGWNEALDAAREAVAKQKLVPLAKQGRFIITRNTKLWDQRQAWSELGWWDFRDSALAAIDALKEDNDQRSQAKGVKL